MSLYSCGSTCIQERDVLKELDPINKVIFPKPALDCLSMPLKVIVLDRIWNCEDRLEILSNQIKAHNAKPD